MSSSFDSAVALTIPSTTPSNEDEKEFKKEEVMSNNDEEWLDMQNQEEEEEEEERIKSGAGEESAMTLPPIVDASGQSEDAASSSGNSSLVSVPLGLFEMTAEVEATMRFRREELDTIVGKEGLSSALVIKYTKLIIPSPDGSEIPQYECRH